MITKPVEIFSETSNYGIVRMPGRQFPGCVIQGDSLSALLNTARVVLDKVKNSRDQDLVGCAHELVASLDSRLRDYEQVLAKHDIPLPYAKRQ